MPSFTQQHRHPPQGEHPLTQALRSTWPAWVHVAVFSAFVNILMLTGSLYMMQLYDRVLASRSIPTLVGVSLIALAAYGLQGWLDHIRQKMLGRIGCAIDAALSPTTLRAALSAPLQGVKPSDALSPFKDLGSLRSFLSSLGPTAFIDMPFTPIFLIVCFALHPWLGWLTIFGMAVIVALTVLAERLSASPSLLATRSSADQSLLLEVGRRNAETIAALGMTGAFLQRFGAVHDRHVEDSMRVSDRTSALGAFAKTFRLVLQSAVLGLGAFLVIRGELSAGAMLAASIVVARALAPVELAVSHLKASIQARQAFARLMVDLRGLNAAQAPPTAPPAQVLEVVDLALASPGTRDPIVSRVTFSLRAGEAVGLIGPSGSGKSTIAKGLAGIWRPLRGEVRYDGMPTVQWPQDALGRAIGYLPQDVELFPGTVADNIARFDPDATAEAILAAAEAAGAHEMISHLPQAYETVVGEGGIAMSGGQRQRIALARALYGDPFAVILDEPNSSLDSEGDEALARAVTRIKARGGVVVVVTHRPSGLAAIDKVGLVVAGRLQAFGPKDQVLAPALAQPARGPVEAEPRILPTRPATTLREIAEAMRQPATSRTFVHGGGQPMNGTHS